MDSGELNLVSAHISMIFSTHCALQSVTSLKIVSRKTYRNLIHSQIISSISNRLDRTIRRHSIITLHSAVCRVRVKVIRHFRIELVSRLGLSTTCIPPTAASTSASSVSIPSASAVGSGLGGSRWFGPFVVPGMGKL